MLNKNIFREIVRYFVYFLIYFLFLIVVNKLYSIIYWPLFVGSLVGLFVVSNLDHLLYVFVFKTEELTSMRANELLKSKRYVEMLSLLFDTRDERKELIFHSFQFQIIFLFLSFWVISSSNNLFAKGLVLSYLLSFALYDYDKIKKNETILNNNESIRNFTIVLFLTLFIFGLML